MTKEFELIEIDPVTGDEDQLVMTGTFAQCQAGMRESFATYADDWDVYEQPWSWYRIQPSGS